MDPGKRRGKGSSELVSHRMPCNLSGFCLTSWFHQEEGVIFAALYWEEPDASGHKFGPDNATAMGSALKEVE